MIPDFARNSLRNLVWNWYVYTGKSRYGGAINGAIFLLQFVKNEAKHSASESEFNYPWIHIDIAPRMTSIDGDFLAKGAAGASIAPLVSFLRKF